MSAVKDTGAMIAGMQPRRRAGAFVFRSFADAQATGSRLAEALGMFREDEGLTLILPDDGRDGDAMACITLGVQSALDGVGLTAAVSAALAEAGIPCNVVAAFHHDHIFVPVAQAQTALDVLDARAASEQG